MIFMENVSFESNKQNSLKNIIIIEDEWVYSECLKKLFASSTTYQYYNKTSFINSDFQMLSNIELIILNIKLGNEDGLDLLPIIKSHNPFVPIIVITNIEDQDIIYKVFERGAAGYLLKGEPMLDIYEQVMDCVKKNRVVISHEILLKLIEHNAQKPSLFNMLEVFTSRERSVIEYLEKGLTQKEIGSAMDISAATVNQHLKHIYQKVNVRSKTELLYKILN